MKNKSRKKENYFEKVSRALSNMFVVVVLCIKGSHVVWSSSNIEVTLIEGEPDSDLKETFLAKIQTPWPRECDRFCQGTHDCLSFTWSPRESTCEVFATAVNSHGYISKNQKFWIAKTFIQSKAGFKNYITMTKSNKYNEGTTAEEKKPEEKDACVTGQSTANWQQAKDYCEDQGMLLYAPKNTDELVSMIQCSKITSGSFWTGYRIESNGPSYFYSDRLMIYADDELLTNSAGSESCLAGTNDKNTTEKVACSEQLNYICQPEYHSEFCESSGNIAKVSELVAGAASDGKKVYISKSPCISRNGEAIKESAINGFSAGFRQDLVTKCSDVKGTSSCDVYVNDEDGYEKCVIVEVDALKNCNSLKKYYLCQTRVFASSHRVKFSDATRWCTDNGGVAVAPEDASQLASILKSVSCLWSITQTSTTDQVIIYTSGTPEVRRRSDSSGKMHYDFYDIAICKV